MQPINLQEMFGRRYRVTFDESYHHERPEFRAAEAPWLMTLPCRHGHIYPWGGDLLAASTCSRGSVVKKLLALPYVQLRQDGSDGINVSFPVGHFGEVARIMKPRRRRRLSESQRRAATERLRAYQFAARRDVPSERRRVRSGVPDSQPNGAATANLDVTLRHPHNESGASANRGPKVVARRSTIHSDNK